MGGKIHVSTFGLMQTGERKQVIEQKKDIRRWNNYEKWKVPEIPEKYWESAT